MVNRQLRIVHGNYETTETVPMSDYLAGQYPDGTAMELQMLYCPHSRDRGLVQIVGLDTYLCIHCGKDFGLT